jgi:hypothetical protein
MYRIRAVNLETSEGLLLMRGEVIAYITASSFMYICRSRSILSKLDDTLLRGKEQWYLGEGRGTLRGSVSQKAGRGCLMLLNPCYCIYSADRISRDHISKLWSLLIRAL